MTDDFEARMIASARQRLAPELQGPFEQLSPEAQADIAMTLLYCSDQIPSVFRPEHLDRLVETVNDLLLTRTRNRDAVH